MTDEGGQWPNRRSPAIDWLVYETRTQPFFDNLFGELCERLVADGLPVDRAAVHIRTLHPQFAAGTIRWEPGMATAELTTHGHEALFSDAFLNSPIRPIFRGEVGGIRQRLDIPLPEGAARYEIYEELRENSQLLVITHQKRTMEVGDALYGVSMRGDGVSAVISQRLRETA